MEIQSFVVLLALVGSAVAVQYAPTIELANGKVRGVVQTSVDGGKLDAYIGIRYGKFC